jgi:hypothetical protein
MPKKSAKPQTTYAQEQSAAESKPPLQHEHKDAAHKVPKRDMAQGAESAAVNSEASPEELPEDRKQAIFSELVWIAETWKRAVEKKDWSTLVDMVGLPEIFIKGHPDNAHRLARSLNKLTRNLCDFEAVPGEFYRQQIAEDSASFTFRLDVMWSSTEDWDEHALNLIVHIGFKRRHEAWVTTYLLFDNAPQPQTQATAPSVNPQPASEGGQGTSPNQPKVDGPTQNAWTGQSENRALTDDEIAEAAAQYFARPSYGELPQPPPPRSKKQLIYLPVLMDADLIRDLLS